MRLTILASLFTAAAMWIALGGNPAQSPKSPTSCRPAVRAPRDHPVPTARKDKRVPVASKGRSALVVEAIRTMAGTVPISMSTSACIKASAPTRRRPKR